MYVCVTTVVVVCSVDFRKCQVMPTRAPAEVFMHGLFMSLAMGVLVPLGVFLPRFYRHRQPQTGPSAWWFVHHQAVQYCGLLFAVVGFGFAVHMTDSGEQFDGAHGRLGLVIFITLILQPLNAVCRPGFYSPNRQRWVWLHRCLGFGCIGLAFINIFLGLNAADANAVYYWIYVAWLCVFGCTYAYKWVQWQRRMRSTAHAEGGFDRGITGGGRGKPGGTSSRNSATSEPTIGLGVVPETGVDLSENPEEEDTVTL